ncbi:PREDICTED: uncharacterized protein LOC104772716 [Camelina sativa]|uniref:Uncharacterized protein LOC104772716 n=1 Tax=Camelina sativa TaxID=90675 RepID=A0ABM0Y504_CAMSA|nr:PREDICTED: uncharacterized protein LOC104772716 [Camelina sativa]
MRIVDKLANEVPYFQQRRDATGRLGLSTLQKCTAAIRMMAYGSAADAFDEYLRLSPNVALACLDKFTDSVVNLFGDEYLRRPTPADLQRLLDVGEYRGFPGMIGSIDCTLNDINILDRSPVFDDILHGRAPKVKYSVNGHEYKLAYYLTDGSICHSQKPGSYLGYSKNWENNESVYHTAQYDSGGRTKWVQSV